MRIRAALRRLFRRKRIVGFVDHFAQRRLRGWAMDVRAPNRRLVLDVFLNGVFLGSARTGQFRQDLRDQGIGTGYNGFVFHLPSDAAEPDGPADFDVFSATATPALLDVVRSGDATRRQPKPPRSPTAFFGAMVGSFGEDGPEPATLVSGPRRQINLLCQSRGSRSAFVEFIALKYDVQDSEAAATCLWYLEFYAVERGESRSPLTPLEKVVADRTFLSDIRQNSGYGHAAQSDWERRYDWAVHGSRRCYCEDYLVDVETRKALTWIDPSDVEIAYPLSAFLKRFSSGHPLTRRVGVRDWPDRAKLYALAMLFALRDPHYLTYIPQKWLAAMLTGDRKSSQFEIQQERLFGSTVPPISAQRFIENLTARGFDISSQSASANMYRGNRVLGGGCILDGSDPVDVQLIGPFRQSLGLAESCRRIALALVRSGLRCNFVDYEIGGSSYRAIPTSFELGTIRPAHINLIHLNPDELPEAIAYLPDAFSPAHNVLIPYWELDRPSRIHRLGLQLVDEVFATSRFLQAVYASTVRTTFVGMSFDEGSPVAKIAGRAQLEALGARRGVFTVLTTADAYSWTRRKNVVGSIEAFREAFRGDADVQLVVKLRNAARVRRAEQKRDLELIEAYGRQDSRLVIVHDDLSSEEQRAIVAGCDCLLSLHRAEGLGLDLLDAVAWGTPVVCTGYSGTVDICTAETAWLVDYDLRGVEPDEYPFVEPGQRWAEPKLEAAVAALRDVYHNVHERERKAVAGRIYAREVASPEALAVRLTQVLTDRIERAYLQPTD